MGAWHSKLHNISDFQFQKIWGLTFSWSRMNVLILLDLRGLKCFFTVEKRIKIGCWEIFACFFIINRSMKKFKLCHFYRNLCDLMQNEYLVHNNLSLLFGCQLLIFPMSHATGWGTFFHSLWFQNRSQIMS